MAQAGETAFDKIALNYDRLWSTKAAGLAQRITVWRWTDLLFSSGESVLDLGCGTGIDALHLQAAGVSAYGIDSSTKMIEIARRRGVQGECLAIERLEELDGRFDGVLSNFGALNCVSSLPTVAATLGRIVRRHGRLALCFLSRFCLWETVYFLLTGEPSKAFRRLRGQAGSSIGAQVFYPTDRTIVAAFQPDFRLVKSCGVGLAVPPSYVTAITDWEIEKLSALDRCLAHWPILRSVSDHRLYIFEKI
jgi:SAM-dependent methyltransferase